MDECILFLNNNPNITPILIIDHNNEKQKKAVEYLGNKLVSDYVVYQHKDVWETTALLSKLDLVLTNKLHVGIVSYALDTIPISIPYHPKTVRFYEQIERPDLCTPIMNLVENKVYDILEKSLDKDWIKEYKNKRNIVHPKLMEKALLNKKYLEEFIGRD